MEKKINQMNSLRVGTTDRRINFEFEQLVIRYFHVIFFLLH